MRVLMISLDKKILEEGSAVQKRQFEYGKICDELHIVVLHANQPQSFDGAQRECESESTQISCPAPYYRGGGERKNVRIYGVKGKNKIFRLWDCYKKAKAIVESGKPHLASPSKGEETKFVVTTQDAGFTGLLGYLLKKKYRVKLNVQIHGQEEKLFNKILLFPLKKRIIKNADSIRVVSERLKKWVVNKYGVDERKIFKIPIWTGLELRVKNQEVRNWKTGELGNCFTILTVGRLVKVKNIKLQIEALAEVIKIFPNIRLIIVGDGPEKRNLQKVAKKYKVDDKVEFEGWQNNVIDYYKKADLFLLTSNSEGWGLAAIDAMAAAVSVIMTDVGCAGEILKNEENSLIIPINDKKSLITAICTMITDVEKRERFSKNAKLTVDNMLDKDKTIEVFRKMWER